MQNFVDDAMRKRGTKRERINKPYRGRKRWEEIEKSRHVLAARGGFYDCLVRLTGAREKEGSSMLGVGIARYL